VGGDSARPVVHWEIVARNPERQAAFHRALFNWQVGEGHRAGPGGQPAGPRPAVSGLSSLVQLLEALAGHRGSVYQGHERSHHGIAVPPGGAGVSVRGRAP
jgi:hypothetical protein